MIEFLKYKKIYLAFSGLLMVLSIIFIFLFGFNFGTDFLGGSSLQVEFKEKRPEISEIKQKLSEIGLLNVLLRPVGTKGIILIVKEKNIDETKKNQIISSFSQISPLEEGSYNFETISPLIGKELREKTKTVILFCLVFLALYISFAFRRISWPVSSFQYGLAGILALCHDVLIPLGIFSLLGRFFGIEFNIPVVCALLTVFAYSIFDTIVIFDRIRENLLLTKNKDFVFVVNKSLNETLARSLNTSFSTLIVLFSMFFVIGEELKYFSLALILGLFFGTYSSIFLAPSLLDLVYSKKKK